jgi:thiamine transport system substrate-binding protein
MRILSRFWAALAVLVLGGSVLTTAQDAPLTVVTHDSFAVSEEVLAAFTAETGITVEIVRVGDTGSLVNQAVLTRDNPLGDVLFGIDNTFLSRGLDNDLFEPYESPVLAEADIDPAFLLDPDLRVTPVDFGDVCLNYDVAYFEENALPVPQTLADLTDPQYRGLLVVQNPASSSPGLAFLLATIAAFGEDGDDTWQEYWAGLVANDVLVVEGWSEAYYGEFTVPSESGTRPLVVSYASSPPAEVYFADPQPETAPTGAITAPGTCFRQIEFAGILAGTDQRAEAEQFIDFLLSVPFQEDLPLQMFVFPVNPQAELPEVFAQYATLAEEPASVPFEDIEANREAWIEAWADIALR